MKKFSYGKWFLEFMPDDGGRIGALSYNGADILCRKPGAFSPPQKDYGLYETRPVYGYDDCFPSVDACKFPSGLNWSVPDHGELCWLKWDYAERGNTLEFKTASKVLPIEFTRGMTFSETSLAWDFKVRNMGMASIPFIHVMHALMPQGLVTDIELPDCLSVFDEAGQKEFSVPGNSSFREYLLAFPGDASGMFILRNISSGKLSLTFREKLKVDIEFSENLFPCLGVWWNNSGYPDENGIRRRECAIEPLPGYFSSLEKCVEDGHFMTLEPEASRNWKIAWTLKEF